MRNRVCYCAVLTLMFVALLAMSAMGAKSKVEQQRITNPLVSRANQFALPYAAEIVAPDGSSSFAPKSPLGTQRLGDGIGPGVKIGDTWYDYQHNGRMGRMVDWGESDPEGVLVHFSWMYLPSEQIDQSRAYAYNVYKCDSGVFLGAKTVQPEDEYAGYVGIDLSLIHI